MVARMYKAKGIGTVVVGDENYGEGSSREHAAMQPRHLGVCVIVTKSFARIHETNVKKQGILALTFQNKADYDRLEEGDALSVVGLDQFEPGSIITLVAKHKDGRVDEMVCAHSYNKAQIDWFWHGSALNKIKWDIEQHR